MMVRLPSFVTSTTAFGNELVKKCAPDAERNTGFTRRAAQPLSKWQRSIEFGRRLILARAVMVPRSGVPNVEVSHASISVADSTLARWGAQAGEAHRTSVIDRRECLHRSDLRNRRIGSDATAVTDLADLRPRSGESRGHWSYITSTTARELPRALEQRLRFLLGRGAVGRLRCHQSPAALEQVGSVICRPPSCRSQRELAPSPLLRQGNSCAQPPNRGNSTYLCLD